MSKIPKLIRKLKFRCANLELRKTRGNNLNFVIWFKYERAYDYAQSSQLRRCLLVWRNSINAKD